MSDFLLKTVKADGTARGGFQWPLDEGAEVTAPDWDPTPVCGGGLHGLLNGAGSGGLIDWSTDAVWIVAEIPDGETVVDLDGKVKVRRCIVRHVGDKTSAPSSSPLTATPKGGLRHCDGRVLRRCDGRGPRHCDGRGLRHCDGRGLRHCDGRGLRHCDGRDPALRRPGTGHCDGRVRRHCDGRDSGTATAGDYGTATAGVSGTATAGHDGTATAGDYGTATAGDYGTATAGVSGTATAGYDGTATAGDYGTATAGDDGTATAGYDGTATAGERGTIIIAWWDSELGRRRWVVGEVGVDGIVADTPYRVVDGALVEVES